MYEHTRAEDIYGRARLGPLVCTESCYTHEVSCLVNTLLSKVSLNAVVSFEPSYPHYRTHTVHYMALDSIEPHAY